MALLALIAWTPNASAVVLLPNAERSTPAAWGYWGSPQPNYWANVDEAVPGGVSTGEWVYTPSASSAPISFDLTTTTMPLAGQVTLGASLSTNTGGVPVTVRLMRDSGTVLATETFTISAPITSYTQTLPAYITQTEIDDMYLEVIGTATNPTFIYALSVDVAPATISGTANNLALCDGTTPVISIVVNTGPTPTTVPCQPGTGAWAASPSFATGNILTVYYDGASVTTNAQRGATWVKAAAASTTPVTGVQLNAQRYRTEARGAAAITGAEIDRWDSNNDTDIRLQVASGTVAATLDSQSTFEIGVGTYQPAMPTFAYKAWIRSGATYTATNNTLRLTGGGTGTCNDTTAGIPFCNAGTFNPGTGTVHFSGAVSPGAIGGGTYNDILLDGNTITYTLGATGTPSTITTGLLRMQNVGGPMIVETSASTSVDVTNDLTITGGTTLQGSANTTITVADDVTGTGTINLTGGTFEVRGGTPVSFTTSVFPPTGSTAWQFANLVFSATTNPHQPQLATGTRGINVSGTLMVGRATDTQLTQLLGDGYAHPLTVTGDLDVTTRGHFNPAPNTVVHGDITISGGVQPTGGTTLTVAGAANSTSTITTAATASGGFHAFSSTVAGKTLIFAGTPFGVSNSVTISGSSCSNPTTVRGAVPGTQSGFINPATSNFSYTSVRDMAFNSVVTATNSINLGNLLNVSFTGGGACGPLVPNADRASTGTVTTLGSAPCTGSARWECVNLGVTTPNDADRLEIVSGAWTQEFELSTLPLSGVVTGAALHFRAAASALSCNVRMRLLSASGAQLMNWATPLTQTFAVNYSTAVTDVFTLNQADVDGMYVEVGLGSACAGATYIGEVNVDLIQETKTLVGAADNIAACDSFTPVIGIAVNGVKHSVVPCAFGTGGFAANPTFNAGDTITVYYDGVAGGAANQGATWVKAAAASTTPVTGVLLNRTRYRTEARDPGNALTLANILQWSYGNDNDIGLNGVSLAAGATFEVGINTFTNSILGADQVWVRTGATLQGGSTLQLSGSGTGTCDNTATNRPFCVMGTFSPGSGNVQYIGTGAVVAGGPYATLTLYAGTYTLGAPGSTTIDATAVSFVSATGSTTTHSPTMNVTGPVTLSAGSTLTGSGSGVLSFGGDVTGNGNINLTGGSVHLHSATGANTTLNASGTLPGTPWQFATLWTTTCFGCTRTVTIPATSREIRASGDLTMNTWTSLDAAAMTRPIVVGGNFGVAVGAGASLPPSLTVAGHYLQVGTTNTGTGTVTLSGSGTATLQAFSPFYDLALPSASKTIALSMGITVTHALTMDGGSCLTPGTLRSDTPGAARSVNVTGAAATIANSAIQDINAYGSPVPATNSADLGGNTGVTFGAGACGTTSAPFTNTTNASAGSVKPTNIKGASPFKMSFINGTGLGADRYRTEVSTSPLDSTVVALFPFDTSLADRSFVNHTATPQSTGPGYVTGATDFGDAGEFNSLGDEVIVADADEYDTPVFTVETWMRTNTYGSATWPTMVSRSGASMQFQLGFNEPNKTLVADVQNSVGTLFEISTPAEPWLDNTWHHIAFTVDAGKSMSLYVDGIRYANANYTGTLFVPSPAVPIRIGGSKNFASNMFVGQLDDVQISNVAKTQAEIAGYVATARPHAQSLWQSWGHATVGGATFPGSVTCTNAARCVDVTYGGDPIHKDGARYYATHQTRTTTGFWSSPVTDWFETSDSISISSPTSLPLGTGAPGADLTGTLAVTTTCTNGTGCELLLAATSETVALAGSGQRTIPPIAPKSPTAPATWAAGDGLGLGFTVLSNTGTTGKDTTRWGTGSSIASPFTNLLFQGASRTPSRLLRTTGPSSPNEVTSVGVRLNAPPATATGSYSGTIRLWAVANP